MLIAMCLFFSSLLILFGCTGNIIDSDKYSGETTTSYSNTDTTMTEISEAPVVTNPPPETSPPLIPPTPRPHFYAGMSVPMPEHITVDQSNDEFMWGFERFKREAFHNLKVDFRDFTTWEELHYWDNLSNSHGGYRYGYGWRTGIEFPIHGALEFVKHFEITFDEFLRSAITMHNIHVSLGLDFTYEYNEIPNPYLLFTFNTERINQFYSIDPAEHAEARQWLIDWLEAGNVPYESYSAFRAANPQ